VVARHRQVADRHVASRRTPHYQCPPRRYRHRLAAVGSDQLQFQAQDSRSTPNAMDSLPVKKKVPGQGEDVTECRQPQPSKGDAGRHSGSRPGRPRAASVLRLKAANACVSVRAVLACTAHSSRGPGRRPLTPVTRVRIPYALPAASFALHEIRFGTQRQTRAPVDQCVRRGRTRKRRAWMETAPLQQRSRVPAGATHSIGWPRHGEPSPPGAGMQDTAPDSARERVMPLRRTGPPRRPAAVVHRGGGAIRSPAAAPSWAARGRRRGMVAPTSRFGSRCLR
jgi:hypothetical protein